MNEKIIVIIFGYYSNFMYLCVMRNITNDTFFDTIDSEIKAYLLGFFIADGCVEKDEKTPNRKAIRLSVNLSEKDANIIQLFKDNICPDNKIVISHYKKGALNRQPTHMIRWSSKYMGKSLNDLYNIIPKKTNDFTFEFDFNKIPDNLVRHFIRGFFDGDGHISYGENTQFTLALYGTALPFLKQIGSYISNKLNVEDMYNQSQKSTMILHALRFRAGGKRKIFIEKLYELFYKDSIYFLNRKKLKFESYLNTVLT